MKSGILVSTLEKNVSLIWEIDQINYGATLSLRAYRRRAQDSEVMVVSLEMLVIIQIIFVGDFCSVICFWSTPNYGATLSLRAYRRRAQDSEEMVVSLLKCWSFIQIIIVGYFCSVICFWNRPNYGATLSLRFYRRRAQDSEVKVVSLLNCQSSTIVLLNFHSPEFIVVPSL